MSMKIRALAITAGLIGSLAAAGAPAQAMDLTLGQPSLSARVAITQPVTVSCAPFDPALTQASAGVSVSVEQASGKSIARGTGQLFNMFNSPLPFVCDGVHHDLTVDVLADPNGPPFHGGQVIVRAQASAAAGQSCGPGCFFNLVTDSASVGPTALKLH